MYGKFIDDEAANQELMDKVASVPAEIKLELAADDLPIAVPEGCMVVLVTVKGQTYAGVTTFHTDDDLSLENTLRMVGETSSKRTLN